MTIHDLQEKIRKLKAEKDIRVLAHSYQAREILEVADLTGDSYALSVAASKVSQKTVVMCGVRFMAETVKILSPDKVVRLAHPGAGCPMAEEFTVEDLIAAKEKYPGYAVVCYINTTAELKTLCDVCVTSSSAVEIVKKLDNDNILFIPDRNLGAYIAGQVKGKNIVLLEGGCPVHARVTVDDAKRAKAAHPNAPLLVHPECVPGVAALADFVGSTSAIMDFAVKSGGAEFIIGTELSIAEHLQYMCPDKRFHALSRDLVCPDMRLTTLVDLYRALDGSGGEEITLPPDVMAGARKCIDRMIEMGE